MILLNLFNLFLIFLLALYFVITIVFFRKRAKRDKALQVVVKKDITLFFWEKALIDKLYLDKTYVKPVVYLFRIALVLVFLGAAYFFGTIAFVIAVGAVIVLFMNRKTADLINEAGINHISLLNTFLDSYVPSLASGLSNDQAMLKFINYMDDEDLFEWWMNKDEPSYKPKVRWKRIIEVYNIIRFNEERGIDDSLPIIEQMQKDLSVKQEYYNNYSSKMGEINPIVISYYVFVPILLFISFTQTKGFWFSIWGVISSIILLVIFVISQFIIYKIKEKAIKTIF